MRSPSSAPPVRRRVGSTEITAMRISGKLARKRFSSSSVTDDLPAPPVPVMPMTGVLPPASCHCLRRWASSASSSSAFLDRGEHAADRDLVVEVDAGAGSVDRHVRADFGAAHDVLDHRHQAHVHAVVGVVDALDAVGLQLADLLGRDRAAAAAEHADVAGAALAQHVDHVLEVLDVAALVADDSAMPSASSCSAARTTSSTLRLWPRCITSAPCAWISRRMMLIAASWPSNRLAAVTKRSGLVSVCGGGEGGWRGCSWTRSIRKQSNRGL